LTCPLCHNPASPFHKDEFFQCSVCVGIFRAPDYFPSAEREKARYEEHHNDVNDPNYQAFVRPITNRVEQDYSANALGLDFGSGTGPVISKILDDAGYAINQYDPFFSDDRSVLFRRYDYIACCEVIEHFHDPEKEFQLLKSLLKPNGRLFCMTHVYSNEIVFDNWYYMRDPTHTFIYRKETLNWIRDKFGFTELEIEGRLVVLRA